MSEAPTPGAAPEQAEPRLLAEIGRGSGPAFDALFDLHGPRLYRLARHLIASEADSEEVLRKALLKGMDRFMSPTPGISGGAWLCGLVVREAYAFLLARRKERRDRRPARRHEQPLGVGLGFDSDDRLTAPMPDWSTAVADAGRRESMRQSLLAAIGRLPDGLRAAWLLADVEALPWNEVGEALDLSIPAAKSRVHRARMLLRDDVGRQLGDGRPPQGGA